MSDPDAAQHRPPADVFTTPTAAGWTRYFPNLPRIAQDAGAQVAQAGADLRDRWNGRHQQPHQHAHGTPHDDMPTDESEGDTTIDTEVSGAISSGARRDIPVLPIALVAEVDPRPVPLAEPIQAPVRMAAGFDPGAIRPQSDVDSQAVRTQAEVDDAAEIAPPRVPRERARAAHAPSPLAAIEDGGAGRSIVPPLAEAVETTAARNDPFAEVRGIAPTAESAPDATPDAAKDEAAPIPDTGSGESLQLPKSVDAFASKPEGEPSVAEATSPADPVAPQPIRSFRRSPKPITTPTSEHLAGRPQANLVRPWVEDTSAKLPPAEFPNAYYGPDSVPLPDGPNQPGASRQGRRFGLPKLGLIKRLKEHRESRILARSGNAPQPGDIPKGR